ncbi:MAG: NAD-dependent deacylase [Ignavibacteriales bacterium]|nr:NAD-dependent deacylase [Ignavibacteriales bacterium]
MTFSANLLNKLKNAERVVVFTGAGISAESGVPTFRGEDGIWKKFKPEELANFDAFMRNTELVWEWYKHRKRIIQNIQPNAGHRAIVEMETYFKSVSVITQNIDNLHRRAGSKIAYELHGNIERNYCIGCGRNYSNEEIFLQETAPRCSSCKGLIRPDVVWFGENLPEDEWNASVQASEFADVFFAVGTSGVVYPAASLPTLARRAGAYIVEINIEPTEISLYADEALMGKAGEVLPKIVELVKKE